MTQEGNQEPYTVCYLPKLRDGRTGVRIPVGSSMISLLQKVQTGSGAHSLVTGGSFLSPEVNPAGERSDDVVRNEGRHISTPKSYLHGIVLFV